MQALGAGRTGAPTFRSPKRTPSSPRKRRKKVSFGAENRPKHLRYPTAENQTKSTRKLPVRRSKIRRTAATRAVPIIPLSRISSLAPTCHCCRPATESLRQSASVGYANDVWTRHFRPRLVIWRPNCRLRRSEARRHARHHSLAANQRFGPRPGTVTLIANLQAK